MSGRGWTVRVTRGLAIGLIAAAPLSLARASDIGQGESAAIVETPLGKIASYRMERLCRAKNLVVGRIDSVDEPFEHAPDTRSPVTRALHHTDLVAEVVIRGDVLPGGKLALVLHANPTGEDMVAEHGRRYLIGFLPMSSDRGYSKKGDPAVMSFVELDGLLSKTSLEELGARVLQHCREAGIGR